MNIRIINLAVLLFTALSVNATITQKIILKNGSELEGYISSQRPGENITFTTEKAVIIMPEENVHSIIEHSINIKDLPQVWQDWGKENEAFIGLGDNRILVLNDIVTKNGIINRVKILERGAKVKYLELAPNQYSLDWDNIAAVKAYKRSKTALSGVNRVYELKSGMQYEGEFVEEVPGKTLSLYRENNYVEVFETSNVIKYSIKKINPNQSLFEQSQLLDVLLLKDGSIVKGIITEQNYSIGENSNYMLIQLENGHTQNIGFNNVAEYRKEVNNAYNPLYDILLHPGEVVLNRKEVKFVTPKENKDGICFDDSTHFTSIKSSHSDTKITIETNLDKVMDAQLFNAIKLEKYTDKKKTGLLKSEEYTYYGFSYGNFVNSAIQPISIETSVNNTTKIIFSIKARGKYVIYNSKNKTAIPFIVE